MLQSSNESVLPMRKLLIPGLLIILLAVLVWPKKSPNPGTTPELNTTALKHRPDSSAVNGHLVSALSGQAPDVPLCKLTDTIAFNPFDPPPPPPPAGPPPMELPKQSIVPIPEEPHQEPSEHHATFSLLKIQAIFHDQSGAAAIIEDRILRAGDKLPDGRSIVHISSAGVELTP